MQRLDSLSRRELLRAGAVVGIAGVLGRFGVARAADPIGTAGSGEDIGAKRGEVPRRRLGRTNLQVSCIGFGGLSIAFDATDQERVNTLLNQALDNGLNFIDTAECYVGSEERIGAAVGNRRDEYVLASKVGHERGSFGGPTDWSPASTIRTIERSLQRLRTDHLDIVHLHSCPLAVLKNSDAIAGLQRAREQGKVRFIGYSGDGAAAAFAAGCGELDTVMISINVFDQEAIEKVIPIAREKDIGMIVKRPLANAVWRYADTPDNGYYRTYWRRMNTLAYDWITDASKADEGPDGVAGTALRFVLDVPGVHSAIVGTTTPGRWAQNNASAAAGPLPAPRFDAIRARWIEVAPPTWVGQI